jgi:PKHD-type hydroxylase
MWQLWKNYMPALECERLIAQALPITPIAATTFGGADDIRRSKIRWISRMDPAWDWLFRDIEFVFRRANVAFGFDLNIFHEVQFTEYDAEDSGHYGWHEDLKWVPAANTESQRKLSLVIQLSDPASYEGGDLELQINDNSPLPENLRAIGTTMVFPAFTKHRVTPVTKGKRYSLVTWYEGPPFK